MICPKCNEEFDVYNATERDGKWYCPNDGCELNDSDASDEDSRLEIKWFAINTHKPEEFVNKLEELYKEYSYDDYYFFNFK